MKNYECVFQYYFNNFINLYIKIIKLQKNKIKCWVSVAYTFQN